MKNHQVYSHINNILIVGYGSIARGLLPLIHRHFTFDKITIIDPHPVIAPETSQKIEFLNFALTELNYKDIIAQYLNGKFNFCVCASVGTSSHDLILECQRKKILYIDTVQEKWETYYQNKGAVELKKKTNYYLRETMHAAMRNIDYTTTAVYCCGANPGMVSWLVKEALINLAKDLHFQVNPEPQTRNEWALLMKNLGVKGIHIAERDTQKTNLTRPQKQFWGTWSVEGFIEEAFDMPSELGWGTHQKQMPKTATEHDFGCKASIYMREAGIKKLVKSWCPTLGPQQSFLITHEEATTIADYYTVRENDEVVYRPTCNYAYHPCEDTISSVFEVLGTGKQLPTWKILNQEITEGFDQLGVLLYGHAKNAYWYGSQLDIHSARERAPCQNATALQVTSAMLAAMVWAIENPEKGLVEPDHLDYKRCLEIQRPYVSPINGYYTDWTPLQNKLSDPFGAQEYDEEDPWQFKNIVIQK